MYLFTFFFLSINAYYHTTHEFLGSYLEEYIKNYNNNLFINVKNFVHNEPLSQISTWADKIKSYNKYNWSKSLHYIDINKCSQNDDITMYCDNGCIYTGILNITNDLKYNQHYTNNYENFKFLLHFLQDLNQPMHLLGFHRGGNDFPIDLNVNNTIRKTNLHTLWDSILPEYYLHHYKYHFNNFQYYNISSIYEYDHLLKTTIFENLNIICNLPISKSIKFDNYFNKTIIEKLFNNYMTITVNTLIYIFN